MKVRKEVKPKLYKDTHVESKSLKQKVNHTKPKEKVGEEIGA
jgi:hypothetical protein